MNEMNEQLENDKERCENLLRIITELNKKLQYKIKENRNGVNDEIIKKIIEDIEENKKEYYRQIAIMSLSIL